MHSLRVELKKPTTLSAVLGGVPVLLVLLLSWMVVRTFADAADPVLLFAAFAAVVVIVVGYLVRRHKSRPAPWIDVFPDRIELVTGDERRLPLPFRELVDLAIVGPPDASHLHVGTLERRLVLPVSAFVRKEDAEVLVSEVRARVEAFVADGRDRLILFERRARTHEIVPRGRIPVTEVILVMLLIGYGLQDWSGAFEEPILGFLMLGANSSVLVREGEWFRLVSGNFLHAFSLHLLLNAVAIWNLGGVMERTIGPHRYLIIYVLSAIGGSVASILSGPTRTSVGASTAAFGLLGAFFLLHLRKMVPKVYRQTRLWWVVTLGVNAALPLLVIEANAVWGHSLPYIDLEAHLGGFLVGALSMLLVLPRRAELPMRARPSALIRVLAALTAATVMYGLGRAAINYADAKARRLEVAETMLRNGASDPMAQNAFAWTIAIAPSPTHDQLELAHAAAIEALKTATIPGAADAIADTVATLDFRRGRFDAAVERQAGLVARVPHPVLASQLARFLEARVKAAGPMERPELGGGLVVRAVAGEGSTLLLEGQLDRAPIVGISVYLIAKTGDELKGLLRIPLDPGTQGPLSSEVLGAAPFPPETAYIPALFVAGRFERLHWQMDDEVRTYP